MINTHRNINRESGIALVIALLFLLVTTLLGVSTLQTNLFGEKMTLNSIQRARALEAAEGALLEGETFVRDFATEIVRGVVDDPAGYGPASSAAGSCTVNINGQGGICAPIEALTSNDGNSLDHWVDITANTNSTKVWNTDSRHRSASDVLKNRYQLATAPKFIVEFMGYVPLADGLASTSCPLVPDPSNPTLNGFIGQQNAWPFCSLDRALFRITALATAGNFDETRVMLQSTFITDPVN